MSAASVNTNASGRCAKRWRNPASTSSTDLRSSELAGEIDRLACRAHVVNPKDCNPRARGVESRCNRGSEAMLWSRSWIDRRKKRFPAGPHRDRNVDGFDDISYAREKLATLPCALGKAKTGVHDDRVRRNSERARSLRRRPPLGASLAHHILVPTGRIAAKIRPLLR